MLMDLVLLTVCFAAPGHAGGSWGRRFVVFASYTGAWYKQKSCGLEVVITSVGREPTKVHIHTPLVSRLSTTFMVKRGKVSSVCLPPDLITERQGKCPQTVLMESLQSEIAVMVVNRLKTRYADAFTLYPVVDIMKEYYVTTWGNAGFFVVVSVQNITSITIKFASVAVAGTSNYTIVAEGINIYPGAEISLELRQYEAFQIYDDDYDNRVDFTGTRVLSNHPVVLYAGMTYTSVMLDDEDVSGISVQRGHGEAQLMPLTSWGVHFIYAPTVSRVVQHESTLLKFLVVHGPSEVTAFSHGEALFSIDFGPGVSSHLYVHNQAREPLIMELSCSAPTQIVIFPQSKTKGAHGGVYMLSVIPTVLWCHVYIWSTVVLTSDVPVVHYFYAIVKKSAIRGLILDKMAYSPTSGRWNPPEFAKLPKDSESVDPYVRLSGRVQVGIHAMSHAKWSVRFGLYIGAFYRNLAPFTEAGAFQTDLSQCTRSTPSGGDGDDNDCDGSIDEEILNDFDDDGDHQIDEDLAYYHDAEIRQVMGYPQEIVSAAWRPCKVGKWGPGCNMTCPIRCNKGKCKNDTGFCIEGCPLGYRGHTCEDKCSKGYYGDGCRLKCRIHCKVTNCHHATGKCIEKPNTKVLTMSIGVAIFVVLIPSSACLYYYYVVHRMYNRVLRRELEMKLLLQGIDMFDPKALDEESRKALSRLISRIEKD